MRVYVLFIIFLTFIIAGQTLSQSESDTLYYYVSNQGNDNWSGKLEQPNTSLTDGPFATIQGARNAIRTLRSEETLNKPLVVRIRAGGYELDQEIEFLPQDSGTELSPIIYRNYPGEKVTLSGGRMIQGQWKKHSGDIYAIKIPRIRGKSWEFNQLFVNKVRQTRARTPNQGYYKAYKVPSDSRDSFIYNKNDINKNWKNLNNVQVVVFHSWSESRLFIKDVIPDERKVLFTGPAAYDLDYFTKYPRYWVENVFEALDQPGEWYLDRQESILYYWPPDSIDLETSEVVAPVARQLIKLAGNKEKQQPVEYLTFSNLIFSYTGYEFPDTGYANGGGAVGPVYRPSALLYQHANDITLQNCLIENVATYCVELADSCSDCLFQNNIIRYAGGGGIVVLKGSDIKVINNHIHHCGEIFFGGTGVVNPNGLRSRIAHNHIHDMPYCGIRGGNWNIELNEVIEYNHIHHIMKMLNDGAGVFNCGIGSVIRNNRVHDSHGFSAMGWGLYLDHYRTNVTMENNIVYNTRSGGLHLHDNWGNNIVNNIFAFGKDLQISITRFHGIVFSKRMRKYRHPIQTFQHNIVYWDEGVFSYNLDCNRLDLATAPEHFDYNVYYKAKGDKTVRMGIGHGGKPGYDTLECWQELGLDKHSIEADPLFVNPAEYDFRLQPNSPALDLGFNPIDTQNIGLLDKNIGPRIY